MRAVYEQLDFFPAPISVDPLDSRAAGAQSHVRALYAVRLGHDQKLHRVFDDRHGVYCEEHGPGCEAAARVRTMAGSSAPSRASSGRGTSRRASA